MGALNGSFNLLLGSSAVLGHKPGVDNGRKVAKYFLFFPSISLSLSFSIFTHGVCACARSWWFVQNERGKSILMSVH